MAFDLGSEGERRLGGRPIGGNDVIVGRAGAQFDILTAERHRGFNFALPEALVVEAIGQREPAAESRARNDVLSSITDCDLWTARVRRMVDALLRASDALPAESRVLGHASADMCDSLVALLLLPWRRSDSASIRPVWYQRLPIARRVTDFMHANLGEPLMMHDLCGAARASQRAVEYAFQDVYGVGPKQYLKMLRLNQVRRDLRTLPGDVASVTSIAHQYGFWHLGHFSVAYRQLFGETPRQTRRRQGGLPEVIGSALENGSDKFLQA
jgi:AraC family ethanolamine operon transcriptional activator